MMTERTSQPTDNGVSHVDALSPGTRLAEFEILSLLGVGGFGMVYKAFDHSLHRAVAIKEYMPSAFAGRAQGQSLWVRSSSDQQTFQAGLASFVDEARLLAQFDHPSLVKVFRFWEANNTAYMVMPLYSGMTLRQARAQMRTPPPEAWLRKVLWSVLGALRVLHDANTLHRDISPENIFLQDTGPPVLLDLGAARRAINDQDHKQSAVLKVNYAPIEQYSEGGAEDAQGLRQGPWSDFYSLAAVVHNCLCNDTPLPATLRSIRDRMVSFSRVARTVNRQFGVEYSAPFVTVMSQSLALRPEKRPQSIDEFLQAMEMTSPPDGVDHFDFRADLGDIWVEPADQPGPGLTVPTVDVTSAPKVVAEIQAQAQALRASVAAGDSGDGGASDKEEDARLQADAAAISSRSEKAEDSVDTVFLDMEEVANAKHARHSGSDRKRHHARSHAPGGRSGPDPQLGPADAVHQSRQRRPVGKWIALGMAGLVLAVVGIWWAQQGLPRSVQPPTLDPVVLGRLAQSPAAVASQVVVQPPAPFAVASEAPPPPLTVAASDTAVAQAAMAASEPPAPAPAIQTAASVPPTVAASPPRVRAPRRAVVQPVAAPATIVVQEPPPPEPPLIIQPRPAPRVPSPQEVCAGASFLARPMCIHQECQKPAQAGQAVCVENRRRKEAEEERKRFN